MAHYELEQASTEIVVKLEMPDNSFTDNVLTLQEIRQVDWDISSMNIKCEETTQNDDHICSLSAEHKKRKYARGEKETLPICTRKGIKKVIFENDATENKEKLHAQKNDNTENKEKLQKKKPRTLAKTKETVYMIRKLLKFFNREKKQNCTFYKKDPEKRLAMALNINVKTVRRLTEIDQEEADEDVVDDLNKEATKDKPVPRKQRPRKITEDQEEYIRNIVNELKFNPTINQMKYILIQRGMDVSRSTLARTLKRLQISSIKRIIAGNTGD